MGLTPFTDARRDDDDFRLGEVRTGELAGTAFTVSECTPFPLLTIFEVAHRRLLGRTTTLDIVTTRVQRLESFTFGLAVMLVAFE